MQKRTEGIRKGTRKTTQTKPAFGYATIATDQIEIVDSKSKEEAGSEFET